MVYAINTDDLDGSEKAYLELSAELNIPEEEVIRGLQENRRQSQPRQEIVAAEKNPVLPASLPTEKFDPSKVPFDVVKTQYKQVFGVDLPEPQGGVSSAAEAFGRGAAQVASSLLKDVGALSELSNLRSAQIENQQSKTQLRKFDSVDSQVNENPWVADEWDILGNPEANVRKINPMPRGANPETQYDRDLRTYNEIARNRFIDDQYKSEALSSIRDKYGASVAESRKRQDEWIESIKGNSVYEAGERIDKFLNQYLEQTPEEVDRIANQIASGTGSLAAMLGGGVIGGATKAGAKTAIGKTIGTALEGATLSTGVLATGGEGIQDAIQHNASAEQAAKALLLNNLIGTSEFIPLTKFLEIANKSGIADDIAQKAWKEYAKDAATGFVEEGIQEGFQAGAQDITAKYLAGYDPSREISIKSVLEPAGVGGASGAIASPFLTFMGRRARNTRTHEYESMPLSQDVRDNSINADIIDQSDLSKKDKQSIKLIDESIQRQEGAPNKYEQELVNKLDEMYAGQQEASLQSPLAPIADGLPQTNADIVTPQPRIPSSSELDEVINGARPIEDIIGDYTPQPEPDTLQFDPNTPQQIDYISPEGDAGFAYFEPDTQYAEAITPERSFEDILKSRKPVKVESLEDLELAGARAATSPMNELPEPTEAQKEAGNYQKGHISLQGLDISIENPRGSIRSGKDEDGNEWQNEMSFDYGYIKRTEGADGDHVDVFVGDNPEAGQVFVIDTINPKTGEFDEHKVFLGFGNLDEAKQGFARAYGTEQALKRYGGFKEMPLQEFKEWVKQGKRKSPVSDNIGRPKYEYQQTPLSAPMQEVPTSRRDVAPRDLLKFLAERGGIRDDRGDLRVISERIFVPGSGQLIRRSGMDLDYAREAAQEAGYGDFQTINDLLDAIERSVKREKVFPESESLKVIDRAQAKRAEFDPVEFEHYANSIGIDTEGMEIEDMMAAVQEREAIEAEEGDRVNVINYQMEVQDALIESIAPDLFGEIQNSGLSSEERLVSDYEASNVITESEEAQGGGEALSGAREPDAGRDAVSEEDSRGDGQDRYTGTEGGKGRRKSKTEVTKAGEQYVIQGAEKDSDAEMAQRGTDKPLRAEVPQQGLTGEYNLFDQSEAKQQDLLQDLLERGINNNEQEEAYVTSSRTEGQPLLPDGGSIPEGSEADSLQEAKSGGIAGSLLRPERQVNKGRDRKRSRSGNEKESITEGDRVGAGVESSENDSRGTGDKGSVSRNAALQRLENFRITDSFPLGEGSAVAKYDTNIRAIEILKSIQSEKRAATPEDQDAMARYVGWGGLVNAFPDQNGEYRSGWKERGERLKELLTPSEYSDAMASTINAHYTSRDVISAVYDGLQRIGFQGGSIMEPGAGIGNFMGLIPDSLSGSKFTAIELDKVSSQMAALIYPKNKVINEDITKVNLPENHFDAVVGNVPFANVNYNYKGKKYSLHDYSIMKSIDSLKPEGVAALITSRYSLDKRLPAFRDELNKKAELVAAIRLPETAFKSNAGTEVVTDILFLRKRSEPLAESQAFTWEKVATANTPTGQIPINAFYVENPQYIVGELAKTGSMYGKDEPTVVLRSGQSFEAELNRAISEIPELLPSAQSPDGRIINDSESSADTIKVGNIYFDESGVLKKKVSEFLSEDVVRGNKPVTNKDSSGKQIQAYLDLRDALRKVLDSQVKQRPENIKESARAELNDLYDKYVSEYGYINQTKKVLTKNGEFYRYPNISLVSEDQDVALVSSIENYNAETGKASKAAIMSQDVIRPEKKILSVQSAADGLFATLSEKGKVDLDHISQLYGGKPKEAVISELGDSIYKDPSNGTWITADEYLSGNVRAKLKEAKVAAEKDNNLSRNVEALERVQPIDLKPSEISFDLGTPWIPTKDIEQFMKDILKIEYPKVTYFVKEASWKARDTKPHLTSPTVSNIEFGTKRISSEDLLELSLNKKMATIYDTKYINGKESKEINQQETMAARSKQELIKQKFVTWLFSSDERAKRLVDYYNENFNNIRERQFNGELLQLAGSSNTIALRKHQKDAVWRILQGGNTLLAHEVGAGKTFTMIAAGMEGRRIGTFKKPMYIVPNHMLEQFSREFLQLYPTANILVAPKEDFTATRRKALTAKIATNDWDAVILTHSSFERIGVSLDFQERFIEREIEDYRNLIEEGQAGNDRNLRKEIEKSIKRLSAKLEALSKEEKKDRLIDFEELGVDQLFVDEAHLFKNLQFVSKMTRVSGLPKSSSQRSFDLFMKARYLDELKKNSGVVFATATPISNTMAEMYTMIRFLRPDLLEQRNLSHFDAWASTFGNVIQSMEISVDGKSMRPVNSFAKFVNIPELNQIFKEFADVQTAEMLNLPRPKLRTGKRQVVIAPETIKLSDYTSSLIRRLEDIRSKKVTPDQDNVLKVSSDGRKAGLDMRMVGYGYDLPDSKVNVLVKKVYEIWESTKDDKLTQIIFSDLGTPSKDRFNVYDDIVNKLVELGVPEKQLSKIHDYDTDEKKARLFKQVREGSVRILLGSTAKLGVGTNVQQRLIALHHLDAPWKPSDLQQREGRILRQGNQNPEVDIYAYITEGSFDSFMWQKLEKKAGFIGQIMRGNVSFRTGEDISGEEMSYAEIKAIATGNPEILELSQLEQDLRVLLSEKRNFEDEQFSVATQIASLPNKIKEESSRLELFKEDAARIKIPDEFSIKIGAKKYSKRADANADIFNRLLRLTRDADTTGSAQVEIIGSYAGMDVVIRSSQFRSPEIGIKGNLEYVASIEQLTPNVDFSTRVENLAKKAGSNVDATKQKIESLRDQFDKAKELSTRKFDKGQAIKEKQDRINDITEKLSEIQKEAAASEIIDETAEIKVDMTDVVNGDADTPDEYNSFQRKYDNIVGEGDVIDTTHGVQYRMKGKWNKEKRRLARKVESRLKRIVGDRVNLRLVDELIDPVTGDLVEGKISIKRSVTGDAYEHFIYVALSGDNPLATVTHEIFHYLFRSGAFTQQEMYAMAEKAEKEWIKKYNIEERYEPDAAYRDSDMVRLLHIEEAMAERAADYSNGFDDGVIGRIKDVFDRIIQFFKELRGSLQSEGINNVDDIFDKILRGEYKEKAGKGFLDIKVKSDGGLEAGYARGIASKFRLVDNPKMFEGSTHITDPFIRDIVRTSAYQWISDEGKLSPAGRKNLVSILESYNESTLKKKKLYEDRLMLRRILAEYSKDISDIHKNKVLTFSSLSQSEFMQATKRLIYKSPVYNGRQSSEYHVGIINDKPAFIRKSNHWGEFRTNIYEGDPDAEGLTSESGSWYDPYGRVGKRHFNWELKEGKKRVDNKYANTSQIGYLYLEDVLPSLAAAFTSYARKATKLPESLFDTNFTLPSEGIFDLLNSRNKKMLSNPSQWKRAVRTSFDNIRWNIQDRMLGFKKVQQAIERTTGGKLSFKENVYLVEELASGRKGAKFEDLKLKYVQPMVNKLAELEKKMKEANAFGEGVKNAMEYVEQYMMVRHAPERNVQIAKINPKFPDGGSGILTEDAKVIIQSIEGGGFIDEVKEIAALVDKMLSTALEMKYQAGLITKETYVALKDTYKYYVPLRGFKDLSPEGELGIKHGKGYDVRGAEYKRAFGRKTLAADIIANSMAIAEEAIIRSENNRVSTALYNLATNHPNENIWVIKPMEVVPVLNGSTGLVEYRSRPLPDSYKIDDTIVVAKIQGKDVRIQLKDKRLAMPMRNMDIDNVGAFVNAMAKLNRYLSLINTGLSPEFIISNAFRDYIGSNITIKQFNFKKAEKDIRPNYFKAMRAIFQSERGKFNDSDTQKWFAEFKNAGGMVAYNHIDDLAEKSRKLFQDIALLQEGKLNAGKRGMRATMNLIRDLNTAVENTVRLTTYITARQNGVGKDEAASIAKNITVNFNRRGMYGYQLNAFYLFYNAGIQSTQVLLHAMKNKSIRRTIYGIALMGYAMEMLNAFLSDDDDEGALAYDKVPDWLKESNMIIMLPKQGGIADLAREHLKVSKRSGVEYVSIPMPYFYRFFYNIGQNLGSYQRGAQTGIESTTNIATALMNNANPIGGSDSFWNMLAPTAIDPVIDFMQNRDWKGDKIVPDTKERTPPPESQRAAYNTTAISKAIAETINSLTGGDRVVSGAVDISPAKMDYLFQYFTGSLGRFVKDASQTIYQTGQKVVGKTVPEEERLTLKDVPFLRKVLGGTKSIDMSAGYDRLAEIEHIYDRLRDYEKEGDIKGFQRYKAENIGKLRVKAPSGEWVDMIELTKATRKSLRELRKRRDAIKNSSAYTQEQKSARINNIRQSEESLMKNFNRLYLIGEGKTANTTRLGR